MSASSLCALPLHEVAKLIRAAHVSPVEVTEAALAAIERDDPALNSFITTSSEFALARARELTDELAAGDYRGKLHGIPMSLKDNIDTAGVRTTAGSLLFADRVPDADAESWRRLAGAGAVLVGKNNSWELAFGGPHPEYGPTWNPWDTTCTAGGTSSGSAAAVAAGLSFASLGTDTGGSARVPASLCGLVCVKPTFGRVPREGVLPVSYSMDHVCPITREVRDAGLILSALFGEGDASEQVDLERDLAGVTIGVPELRPEDEVRDDVRAVFDRAIEVIAGDGATIREVKLPDPDAAGAAARVLMDSEAADFHRDHLRTRADAIGEVALNRLQAAEFIAATHYVRAQRVRRRYTDWLEEVLQSVDAVAFPGVGVTAFPVADDGFSVKEDGASPLRLLGRFTPLVNMTGHPAVVVPCGLGADGMPASLQFIGRFMQDHALLAIARAYERATDWHSLVPRKVSHLRDPVPTATADLR
jgi:aspartyl-tRNA(Asn)/glutamyl-tRNA(Gln) amidotransferase subunit A